MILRPKPKGVYPQSDGGLAVVDIDASKWFVDMWVHLTFAIFAISDEKRELKVKVSFSGYTIYFKCDAILPEFNCFISMIISVDTLCGFSPLITCCITRDLLTIVKHSLVR